MDRKLDDLPIHFGDRLPEFCGRFCAGHEMDCVGDIGRVAGPPSGTAPRVVRRRRPAKGTGSSPRRSCRHFGQVPHDESVLRGADGDDDSAGQENAMEDFHQDFGASVRQDRHGNDLARAGQAIQEGDQVGESPSERSSGPSSRVAGGTVHAAGDIVRHDLVHVASSPSCM